jgi:hypothetical protein
LKKEPEKDDSLRLIDQLIVLVVNEMETLISVVALFSLEVALCIISWKG